MLGVPHGVKVVLKDGRTFYGPIWEWNGKEGWFTLVIDTLGMTKDQLPPERFYLHDCVSAVDRQQRTNRHQLEDVDLFERARRDGWSGA